MPPENCMRTAPRRACSLSDGAQHNVRLFWPDEQT
jgi:hypothetical protein